MKYLISIVLVALMPLIACGVDVEDGDVANWEVTAIRSNGDIDTDGGINVGLDATVSSEDEITASDSGVGSYQKVVITLEEYEMNMVTNGSASDCEGAVKLIDFPEGYVEVTGIHCDLELVNTESGVEADTQYDIGLGSTETDGVGGELDTSTDYNYLGKIEGDLSSYEADIESQSVTDVGVDGTATAADMWLNSAYLDSDVTDETTATWNGTVTVYWRILGDD